MGEEEEEQGVHTAQVSANHLQERVFLEQKSGATCVDSFPPFFVFDHRRLGLTLFSQIGQGIFVLQMESMILHMASSMRHETTIQFIRFVRLGIIENTQG